MKYYYLVSWQHDGDKSLICQCQYFMEHVDARRRYEDFKTNPNFKHVTIIRIEG